jgi:putative addiction module component, TIGR02574 family
MSQSVEKLFREASDLPETERAELAGMLLDSLESERDEGVEAAWAEEIERRVRQIESGEVRTIPWEEVRAKLYASLNEER